MTPSPEVRQVETAIHNVIESLIDSQEALVEIGEKLHDEFLKHYLLAESLTRAQFRGELESVLNQEGVSDLREAGTAAGTAHRVWANLKSKLGGGDPTLLATAAQGENAANEAYQQAISTSMPLPIRQLLTSQAAHIQESHDFMEAARSRLHEAA